MRNFILILLILVAVNIAICVYTKYPSIGTPLGETKPHSLDKSSHSYFKFDPNMNPNNNMVSQLSVSFKNCFDQHGIPPASSYDTASMLFFKLLTDYKNIQKKVLHPTYPPRMIFSLFCIDKLASKSEMFTILSDASHSLTNSYTPKTYVLNHDEDMKALLSEYDSKKLYILKKNIQRQQGCTITNNIEYVKQAAKNNYVVCQELLRNVFTINGHKINIRQYLVITVKSKCTFYLYNDGFIYYAPKKYAVDSHDTDRHITTGYIDRRIYETNPMTTRELFKHIGPAKARKLKENLVNMFGFVAMAYKSIIEKHDSNQHTNFVILGCDVAIDKQLGCKLMEINKGPDLTYKDNGRDMIVKKTLVENTLHELGVINSPHDNFMQI